MRGRRRRSIDIVFFDAGGTLLYPEPSVGEVYALHGRRHGVEVEPAALEASFDEAFARRQAAGGMQDEEWWWDVVRWTFEPFGEGDDPDGLFDALYSHFASARAWRLYPGALETAAALRDRGYRTGLISNWDDRLPGLLDGLGLRPGLDPVIVSGIVGAEKPDPAIFTAALTEAGVEPPRALMVGDDPVADVAGATSVGMRAVLVARHGARAGDGAIGQLDRLLDLLP